MNEIQKYIAANEPKIMEDLFSLIRIPSISALPEHHDDMLACAERWAQLLLEAGADEALVMPSKGNPIVFAQKMVDPIPASRIFRTELSIYLQHSICHENGRYRQGLAVCGQPASGTLFKPAFRKVYFKDQSQQRRYSLGRNGTKGPCHQNPPALVAIAGSVFCICIALLINHLRRLPIYPVSYTHLTLPTT